MAQGRDAEQEGGEFEAQAVSAFVEAFNNVAIHGYRGLPTGNVDIEVSWSAEEIVIQMTDFGRIFDPDAVEPPALDELPEGGMGLFIIRSFMNVVAYQPGPPNVLRLVKKRGGSEDERGPGSPDEPPFSSETSAPLSGAPSASSRIDRRPNAVDGAGDRSSATWINDGTALGEPGTDPTLRLEARVVGGSRRT